MCGPNRKYYFDFLINWHSMSRYELDHDMLIYDRGVTFLTDFQF